MRANDSMLCALQNKKNENPSQIRVDCPRGAAAIWGAAGTDMISN